MCAHNAILIVTELGWGGGGCRRRGQEGMGQGPQRVSALSSSISPGSLPGLFHPG